jgi:hypothetical protein
LQQLRRIKVVPLETDLSEYFVELRVVRKGGARVDDEIVRFVVLLRIVSVKAARRFTLGQNQESEPKSSSKMRLKMWIRLGRRSILARRM